MNIITKSGTNSLHGSVYEYFRNDVMDAPSPLAAAGFNKLRQNQFGATLGGPIRRTRLSSSATTKDNATSSRPSTTPPFSPTLMPSTQ